MRLSQACTAAGVEPPPVVHAHSTRALSSSTALLERDDTFFHTFLRDESVFSLTHSVLRMLDDQSGTVSPGHSVCPHSTS